MRFLKKDRAGIRDGTFTVAFRRWKRPTVVPGRPYWTGLFVEAEITYPGFEAPVDLERIRLRALLPAGEIIQAFSDQACAETLETITGTVEQSKTNPPRGTTPVP